MVSEQLQARGVTDARVLAAMSAVPRQDFVPASQQFAAYDDRPLQIGQGQTISQPYVVAVTLAAAAIQPTDRVLDVGTGSGYAAAVAAGLAAEVFSIERVPELAEQARERLRRTGFDRVHVITGDGTLGHPDGAPYDAIVAAAAGPHVPAAWKEQLRDGGRIVAPIGPRGGQTLVVITRSGEEFTERNLLDVSYVPLIGDDGY